MATSGKYKVELLVALLLVALMAALDKHEAALEIQLDQMYYRRLEKMSKLRVERCACMMFWK
jgi:hypothetical protein